MRNNVQAPHHTRNTCPMFSLLVLIDSDAENHFGGRSEDGFVF
jgi:hypothetical protein